MKSSKTSMKFFLSLIQPQDMPVPRTNPLKLMIKSQQMMLKKTHIVTLIGSFAILMTLTNAQWVQAQSQSEIVNEIEARVQKFQSRYGIPLVYKHLVKPSGDLHFVMLTEANYVELNTYLKLFEQEINKYPPSFFKSRNIRGIALVKRLFIQNKPAEGLYFYNHRVMFFDILRNNHKRIAQRHSIHHELFHMMSKQTPQYAPLNEDVWASWNQHSFQYTTNPRLSKKINPYNQYAPHEPGFVSYYAMTSVEEDKAEVFACLMQYKHKKLIHEWITKDRIMSKKVAAIKGFAFYFCSDMDTDFWNGIKN
ncbi:MAG: putative zinc-binding metallopeptidase [Candidatus Omnitrophica bacterium]|nr:putative zinc-binding metallopeptidase [Candidatus Omnitrophota bacterium]